MLDPFCVGVKLLPVEDCLAAVLAILTSFRAEFQYKVGIFSTRYSYCDDLSVMRSSYIYYLNSYAGTIASLRWNGHQLWNALNE